MLRWKTLRAAALALAALAAAGAARAVEIGEDGLHKQPWFSYTFKDLREDIQTAREQGKRLVLFIEQRGCIYCKKMHEEVYSDPEIADFIARNFMVVQINMFGDEEVTDLDGATLTEKEAVRRWGVLFTPTALFMPDTPPEDGRNAAQAAVATVPGAFGKGTTRDMYQWVLDKGYEGDEPFQRYHARMIEARRKGQ
ncbi:thioredoxin family protein [Oceanicella actignis]|uniref:thioredoxin family protein n=1 Tax=Oceanicella actignis TaxID=1189325 RepID=UPI0011E7569A|nr:thioredoxin family protein [Oceanicella actignis]TYO91592.1 thioredoxin-like protein [Oceanicella actignis]